MGLCPANHACFQAGAKLFIVGVVPHEQPPGYCSFFITTLDCSCIAMAIFEQRPSLVAQSGMRVAVLAECWPKLHKVCLSVKAFPHEGRCA